MARGTLQLVLTILLTGLLVLDVPAYGQEDQAEFIIEGKNRTPVHVSFDYEQRPLTDSRTPHFSTADTPTVNPKITFRKPTLSRGIDKSFHPELKSPNSTVVRDYSILELLGIGAGIAIMIGIL